MLDSTAFWMCIEEIFAPNLPMLPVGSPVAQVKIFDTAAANEFDTHIQFLFVCNNVL
jgi:hypothetical protein